MHERNVFKYDYIEDKVNLRACKWSKIIVQWGVYSSMRGYIVIVVLCVEYFILESVLRTYAMSEMCEGISVIQWNHKSLFYLKYP